MFTWCEKDALLCDGIFWPSICHSGDAISLYHCQWLSDLTSGPPSCVCYWQSHVLFALCLHQQINEISRSDKSFTCWLICSSPWMGMTLFSSKCIETSLNLHSNWAVRTPPTLLRTPKFCRSTLNTPLLSYLCNPPPLHTPFLSTLLCKHSDWLALPTTANESTGM